MKVPHAFYNRDEPQSQTDHATNPRKATQPADRVRSDPDVRLAGDDGTPGHRSRSLVASAHRTVDRGIRSRPPHRPFFLHARRASLGLARVVVGSRVLRTLEARRRRRTDRVLRDHYDRRLYAALSALSSLWGTEALGGRSDGLRRSGFRSLLGRAAADVNFYSGQPVSMAA